MNPLLFAAREVFEVLSELKVSGCLIGGMALQRWGEPRLTLDIDLTLSVDVETQDQIVEAIMMRFKPRISDAKSFALARRVLLLKASNGIGVDAALGLTSFEAETVERSSSYEFAPGFAFPTCSAEDLIVHKCFAGRGRDLADVETVIARHSVELDLVYIRHWLTELSQATDNSEILARFETLLTRVQTKC